MATHGSQSTSPTSHRLPTVSASQALQDLHIRRSRTVSSGLTQLDRLLSAPSLPGHNAIGGYPRGKVTEIFGPSGVGKTTFGLQAAVNAVNEGEAVVWIDAGCAPLTLQRVLDVHHNKHTLQEDQGIDSGSAKLTLKQLRGSFQHFAAPTLAHLLALFMHPPASFPQRITSLVIVDSLSTLIDNSYPRNAESKPKTEQSRWAAGRRFTVINELMATFSRFAAIHHVAVVVTCQTITRIRGTSRAVLVPAISGVEWENGVSTRLVLFRDWVRQGRNNDSAESDRLRKARFAGLIKANGVALADEGNVGDVVPFAIESTGLCDINIAADDIATRLVFPVEPRPPKRLLADMEDDAGEEPNSDELYGWIEDDEVAAEGLLIDENNPESTSNPATSQQDPDQQNHSHKMMRLSTV